MPKPPSAARLQELEDQIATLQREQAKHALKSGALQGIVEEVLTDEMKMLAKERNATEYKLQKVLEASPHTDADKKEAAELTKVLTKLDDALSKHEQKHQFKFKIAKAVYYHGDTLQFTYSVSEDIKPIDTFFSMLKKSDTSYREGAAAAKGLEVSIIETVNNSFSKIAKRLSKIDTDFPNNKIFELSAKAKSEHEKYLLLETLFSLQNTPNFNSNLMERLAILNALQMSLIEPAKLEVAEAAKKLAVNPSSTDRKNEANQANKKMDSIQSQVKRTKSAIDEIKMLKEDIVALSSKKPPDKENLAKKQRELQLAYKKAIYTITGAYLGSKTLNKFPDLTRRWREADFAVKLATKEERIYEDLNHQALAISRKMTTTLNALDERIKSIELALTTPTSPSRKSALEAEKKAFNEDKKTLTMQLQAFRDQGAKFNSANMNYKLILDNPPKHKQSFWSRLPLIGHFFVREDKMAAAYKKNFMRAMTDYSVISQKMDNMLGKTSAKLAALETEAKKQEAIDAKFTAVAKDREDFAAQLKSAETGLKAAENKNPTSTSAVLITLEQAPAVRYRPDLREIEPYMERLQGSLDSENVSEAKLLQMPPNRLANTREGLRKDQSMVFYLLRAVKDNPAYVTQLEKLYQELKTKINFISTILTKTSGPSHPIFFKSDEPSRDSEVELPELKTLDNSSKTPRPGAGG